GPFGLSGRRSRRNPRRDAPVPRGSPYPGARIVSFLAFPLLVETILVVFSAGRMLPAWTVSNRDYPPPLWAGGQRTRATMYNRGSGTGCGERYAVTSSRHLRSIRQQ